MPLKKLAKQHRTDSADNLGDSGSLSPVHDTAVNSNKYINGNAYSSSGNDCNVHNNDAVHNNNSVNVNVNTNEEPAETFYSPRTAICRSFSKNPDELYSKLCSELSREEFMQIIYNDPVPVNPFSYLCGKTDVLRLLYTQPDEIRSKVRSRLSLEEFMQVVYGQSDDDESDSNEELPF